MTNNPFVNRNWKVAHGRSLVLGSASAIMGVVNVTPDSFSDGGKHVDPQRAVNAALEMIGQGAVIIDIGGESTRPGGASIDIDTEQARIMPVIRSLAAKSDCLISVDTYRADTAREAIEAGAHIINDVRGLQKNEGMAEVAAKTGAGVVIMRTGRGRNVLQDAIEDQKFFLNRSLEIAYKAGIAEASIVLDPGIGFAKQYDQDIVLLGRFEELTGFGYPLLVGTSRKRFLGAITGHQDAEMRDIATAATSVVARLKGAAVFRVHDVATNLDALKVADALVNAREADNGCNSQFL